jgi:hypothetical protein
VIVGGLLVIAALAGLFVYTITKPDPDGSPGLSPSTTALYYMRKGVRDIAAGQGFRDIAFYNGGSLHHAPFVYLVDSCFEYDATGGRVRVPFFVQMERTPQDAQTYSVVQFKAGQPEQVTGPTITDASGNTPPVLPPATLGSSYTGYLEAVGGYTLPAFNAVTIRPGYNWGSGVTLPPGLTETIVGAPCIQPGMEQCALLISGTPTQAGTYTFMEQAMDPSYNNRQQSITITVNPSPPGGLTESDSPSGTPDSRGSTASNCPSTEDVERLKGRPIAEVRRFLEEHL